MRCGHCAQETPDDSVACVVCGASLIDRTAGPTYSPRAASPLPVSQTPSAMVTNLSALPRAPFSSGSVLGVLMPGSIFDTRYRIDRLLGSGGMGTVYQAWDQELGVAVALKMIRPDIAANLQLARDFERRFKQELLLARQVTHRNVIRIHDLREYGGVKYITMQFVEGTDLALILKRGKMPFERTLSIARQLAAGLAAAHDVGVLHRDLKPLNILVDAADTAYISDFGLAKSAELSPGLTRTGEFMGTPQYVSPEQVQGNPIDHRSDLYALGLIFFEMATGVEPFSGKSVVELMYKRVQEPARDPKALSPDLPEYFRRVVMRCLQRNPNDRYSSAHEILADLEGERAEAPAAAARTISLTLPLPQTRASKFGAAAAVILVIAGLALAIPATRRVLLGTPAAPAPTQIAVPQKHVGVMPLRVLGDSVALGPIAAGIEEALTTKLFQLRAVTVAPAAAVERAATKASLAEISRQLGATLVVTGSVQGSGDTLRITMALDDATSNRRVWAQDFSGVPADLLTIEDQIYRRLITALDITQTAEEQARTVVRPTENVDAYQLYLKGRNAMRGQQNPKNVQAALDLYEQALKHDPAFALAYAGISDSALRLYRATKEAPWAEKALSSALQAQQLDEQSIEVHLALGSVYQATGRTAEAIAELTRAASLAPSSDDVYRRLGRAYLASGRGNESIRAYERAVQINPYYWVSYNALGVAYLQTGAIDKAVDALKKVIELEPANVNGHNDLGAAYLQMGRFRDAVPAFQTALKLQPTAQTYTNLGISYAYSGKLPDAVLMFEKAASLSPNSEMLAGNLGDGYRWAGHKEKAAAAYDTAIALALKDLQVNPNNAIAKGHLALYYAKKLDNARAQKMMADARAVDKTNVGLMYSEAIVHVLGGRTPEALTSLEAAVAAGYPVAMLQSDPDLKVLVSEPRFKALESKSVAKS
jgi:tetratricopeptide (TPR) repeat protein/TolB-like protein